MYTVESYATEIHDSERYDFADNIQIVCSKYASQSRPKIMDQKAAEVTKVCICGAVG